VVGFIPEVSRILLLLYLMGGFIGSELLGVTYRYVWREQVLLLGRLQTERLGSVILQEVQTEEGLRMKRG
jgi:hypothetical protein